MPSRYRCSGCCDTIGDTHTPSVATRVQSNPSSPNACEIDRGRNVGSNSTVRSCVRCAGEMPNSKTTLSVGGSSVPAAARRDSVSSCHAVSRSSCCPARRASAGSSRKSAQHASSASTAGNDSRSWRAKSAISRNSRANCVCRTGRPRPRQLRAVAVQPLAQRLQTPLAVARSRNGGDARFVEEGQPRFDERGERLVVVARPVRRAPARDRRARERPPRVDRRAPRADGGSPTPFSHPRRRARPPGARSPTRRRPPSRTARHRELVHLPNPLVVDRAFRARRLDATASSPGADATGRIRRAAAGPIPACTARTPRAMGYRSTVAGAARTAPRSTLPSSTR